MKFYDRQKELTLLDKIETLSCAVAQMTVVVGRRRIGKTSLLSKASEKTVNVYFFVSKKDETLLCLEFMEEVRLKLQLPDYIQISSFPKLFSYLMDISKTNHFTLIIDEFQEFYSINSAIFSEMQNIWDSKKQDSKINLIICGSVYTLMNRIFQDAKEPLFGRAMHRINIEPFGVSTLKEIISDYIPDYTNDQLLAFYMLTGGVAQYVELMVNVGAFRIDALLEEVLSENSFFLDEGKNVLIGEFGKDYAIYFSILSLIASGKTSRVEIESILEKHTGGYLERLEKDYRLIKKVQPILAKPGGRTIKYQIIDNYLGFWFRFIYKNQGAVEIKNLDYIKDIVMRDYSVYSGIILERYFRQKLIETKEYNQIGSYWERGNRNEIDIVAVNDMKKTVLIAEVKRLKEKINLKALELKAENLLQRFTGYKVKYSGFSLDDM